MNEERDKIRLIGLGGNIRKKREHLNLSQDDVVSRCDVTKGNLSMIENGNKDAYITTIFEIAKGLGVKAKDLFDFE
jgi:transcriptional regulator with XRE-family HTH domain